MEEYLVSEKNNYEKMLDLAVFLAVFVVTVFLIIDFVPDLTKILNKESYIHVYLAINTIVLIIFFLDLVRLKKESSSWSDFLAQNWLDLIATIPFGIISYLIGGSIFSNTGNALKLVKLQKLSKATKISKITKEFKAASKLKKESDIYRKKRI